MMIDFEKNLLSESFKHLTGYGENYHVLFEQATDPILVTDFKGNFRDVNTSFCTLFGYSKEELLCENIRTLLDTKHLQKHPIRFDLLSVGQNIFNERKMLHKDGTPIYVESNAKKLNNEYILVIARNITERKKAEELLRKSEANLHTIFNRTDTIYVLMDDNLRIISYNPQAFDFAKNELGREFQISEYFPDYFPLERRPVLLSNLNTALKGKTVSYEVSYNQPDASVNWYHVRMFPILGTDKNIHGMMAVASNITEKRMLEQQLLRQQVQHQKNITKAVVDALEKERTQIGAELHDNVNQLLTASTLFLDQCVDHPSYDPYILKSKTYLTAALQELRRFSHALVGPSQDETMGLLVSLKELISDISRIKKIKINLLHSAYDEQKTEVGLKLVIYRIIQEQLNNILKYAHASAVDILIKEEGDLVVVISDNGRGFDVNTKKKGIGLKNINNRAELYNGVVEIISSPGTGCTMQITFKRA